MSPSFKKSNERWTHSSLEHILSITNVSGHSAYLTMTWFIFLLNDFFINLLHAQKLWQSSSLIFFNHLPLLRQKLTLVKKSCKRKKLWVGDLAVDCTILKALTVMTLWTSAKFFNLLMYWPRTHKLYHTASSTVSNWSCSRQRGFGIGHYWSYWYFGTNCGSIALSIY